MRKFYFCLFFLYLLLVPHIFAQQPSFRNITTEQSLPSNEVYSMLEDNEGFIWIGCDAGLFRYDGSHFVAYRCDAQKSKSITGLCKSPNGSIYCYNFVGQVFCIKDNKMFVLEGLSEKRVSNIRTDAKNTLWIATGKGIWYYEPTLRFCKQYKGTDLQKPHLRQDMVIRVTQDSHNNTWFMDSLVSRIDTVGKFRFYDVKALPKEYLGNYLLFSHQKTIWLVGYVSGNFYKLIGDRFYPFELEVLKKALVGKKITNITKDKHERIWITTFSGAVMYDFEHDKATTILDNFSFSDFLEDAEGSFWLSTLYDGLVYIPNVYFENWHQEPEKILKISHDHRHIYFGNTQGDLCILDTQTNKIKKYHIPQASDIRSVDYDSLDKAVYFNADQVLYQLKDEKIIPIYPEAGPVKDFKHLPTGYFFATSARSYFLNNFQQKNIETIDREWGRTIAHDVLRNIIWVGTNKGLLKVVRQSNKWVLEKKILAENQILALAFDATWDTLYAVNFEGKVYAIASHIPPKSTYKPFFVLPQNIQVRSMLWAKQKLVLATNEGLCFLATDTKEMYRIGKLEGLLSEDVHSITVFQDKIWLGTTKGLQSIPFLQKVKRPQARLFLKELIINKTKINLPTYLKLPYTTELKIKVESICYSAGDKFKYAYRIRGNTTWNYLPVNTDFVYFSAIPIGKFLIEIKVIDHQGRDASNSIFLEGETLPPFWQTWWFLGSVFCCSLLLFYLFFRRMIAFVKRRQARVLKQMALENELKLWQQTALQTQMNPHFLFNVLNSIKTYIYENDKNKAILYLNNFASLVRIILHNSTKQEVSLHEEIKALKLYIELEAMLLEERFSYQIDISADLDAESIFLPTFLLQPFVENAFKHGLRHQKGDKVLKISINVSETSTLTISITDNGIGRKKANEINQQNRHTHESFAFKNIQERIALLNTNTTFQIDVNIIDLQNNQQEPAGTQIIINIKS